MSSQPKTQELTITEKRARNQKSAKEKNEKKAFQCYFASLMLVTLGYEITFKKAKRNTKSIPYFKIIQIKDFDGTVFFQPTQEFQKICVDHNGKVNKEVYNANVMRFILSLLEKWNIKHIEKTAQDVKEGSKRPGQKNIKYPIINNFNFGETSYDYHDITDVGRDVYETILKEKREMNEFTFDRNDYHKLTETKLALRVHDKVSAYISQLNQDTTSNSSNNTQTINQMNHYIQVYPQQTNVPINYVNSFNVYYF